MTEPIAEWKSQTNARDTLVASKAKALRPPLTPEDRIGRSRSTTANPIRTTPKKLAIMDERADRRRQFTRSSSTTC